MTKVNKIVMHGFKSFAKHTEIMFNDNFNCVLGPNGSGKSNILDAVCFVLGKSSAKSLRAEKATNLIYNGGKTKKPAKQAEVSIFFDNQNKKFPTDEEEVKITRLVKPSGQSTYKINDKVRTRQQILELLSLAKIDPDGYNIILQGDITRFVEMPVIERRMLIEEISGISIYEEKKQKAVNELEKVETKLKEAEIILAERNTYLKELKKDRDQALKFKEMNDKVNENKASLLKLQIDKKEEEKGSIKKEAEKTAKELNELQEKTASLRKENDEKKKQIEEITKDIEEKGEVEQLKLSKETESLKIELTKLNSRLDVCDNEIIKINQRKKDLKTSLDEIDNKISELNDQKEELEKQKSSKTKERQETQKKIDGFKLKNKLDTAADIDKKLEDIDKKLEELQKEINALRENHHNLIREKDKLTHHINTADERIKKVAEIEKQYKTQIEELKNKREEFKNSTLELNKRLNEDSSLAAQLGSSKEKHQRAAEELAKLQAKHTTIKEAASADIAVKKLLSQKDKMKGIYGTVSELGVVSSKYSLALETAAGPRLKSIVVEDDRVAADAIKYLKQNKLGTATFLPLNKIKAKKTEPEIKELSDSKGSYGLAIDLVEFDEKFKKIFDYVFSNTLIVDNIDVARRLGIGKAKMVTIDGDLAERSGVMQGGYRKRKGYGLGFTEKEVTKDIEEYKEVIANVEKVILTLEKRRAENEKKIDELRLKKANLEGDIIKTEKSLHLDSSDLEVSKKQKEGLNKQIKDIDKQIEVLHDKISEKSKDISALKTEKQELKSEINQLRDPALLAELTTFEEKLRETNEALLNINSEIKNTDSKINAIHLPEKEKTNQIIKQIEKEKQSFSKEIDELKNKLKQKNEELKKKESVAKEFYSKFKNLFTVRSKINDEIQKNDNIINKKLDDSRKVEIKNNTLSLKNAEISSALAGLELEFQQYEGVKINTSKSEEELKKDIAKFERLKIQIGSVNMRALEIYDEVEKEYNKLFEKKNTLTKEKEDVINMMNEIESKKKDLFMRTFDVTNENFSKIFQSLSTKGTAHLQLENPENPFEGGVMIKVKLMGNKFLDIRSLSGGEKTLTALAFIFSIQEHEPASFYVLDEVDAALDKHNSQKLSLLVKKYSEKAQYIIISHNDGIITEATNLYGVSMNEHGVSQIVSLKV